MEMNRAFNLHRYKEDSVDDPSIEDDKEFWCVGMNAGTVFYAGVSPNDQLFEFNFDLTPTSKGKYRWKKSKIKPVDNPSGVYWGHF